MNNTFKKTAILAATGIATAAGANAQLNYTDLSVFFGYEATGNGFSLLYQGAPVAAPLTRTTFTDNYSLDTTGMPDVAFLNIDLAGTVEATDTRFELSSHVSTSAQFDMAPAQEISVGPFMGVFPGATLTFDQDAEIRITFSFSQFSSEADLNTLDFDFRTRGEANSIFASPVNVRQAGGDFFAVDSTIQNEDQANIPLNFVTDINVSAGDVIDFESLGINSTLTSDQMFDFGQFAGQSTTGWDKESSFSLIVEVIPAPSTAMLAGVAGLAACRRRRN